MTPRRWAAGWLVAAVLCSSWAVSTASDRAPQARVQVPDAAAGALPGLSADLDAEIARLTVRSQALAETARPSRNLFEFASPAASPSRRASAAPAPVEPVAVEIAAAPVAALESLPSLSAIAQAGGSLTAVISFRDTLHYVRKGDVIAGRYRVDAVGTHGVELFDLAAGTISRLSLQTVT